MTNKHVEDFEATARYILETLTKRVNVHANNGMVTVRFDNADTLLASYLLDMFNDGYDAAILSAKPRDWKSYE